MVCVAQELRCECIVRDTSKNLAKYEVTLPASTSVLELINQVATNMKYEPHSFQLTFQTANSVLTEKTLGTLESVGFSTELGARNSLLLEGINGNERNLVKRPSGNDEATTVTSPTPPPDLNNFKKRTVRPHTSLATDYIFSAPVIRHETGYVGLVNQAMTCYLNSLLQALYMTPEFRNALYKWQFDPEHSSGPNKSIPFQLQKLFLNLQTSTKPAVETTELTRSFGWESGEVWQQHDIQELCRVMFDALEQEFKETEQADLINQLYQGKMIDYVKCLDCNNEKSREDTFLDIPLPVRPFGSTVAYGSIEEALRAFVQPETLEGNNQYLCDNCEKKCDAHKGLKFTKFPYLLTLHLKRFDFDYSTMHRIKLNDKLVFPEVLNLNSFVKSSASPDEAESENVDTSLEKNDDSSIADSALDEDSCNAIETQNNEIDQEEDEGVDVNPGNNHENEKNLKQSGPFLYELYSIMIHSGSASGGHYYAYIKDFAKNEWYCFNDQTVTSITLEDIKKTYGGTGGSARGYYSGAYSSSTNAYMLMYRQINKEHNTHALLEEEFPPHIKKHLEDLKAAEERDKAMRAKQEEMVRIKLYADHPMIGQPRAEKMFCHNDTTMDEIKSMAYELLKLENIVPENQCRLVIYNKSQDEIEESIDGKEKNLVSEVLNFAKKFSNNYELLMEIREKNQKFLPYNLGDIRLTVYMYKSDENVVEGPWEMRTSPCQTLGQLKQLLQDYIHLRTDDLHLVIAKSNGIEYVSDDSLPLNKQGFQEGTFKVFICYKGGDGDSAEMFQESELYKRLDEVKNVITLQMILPDTKKETLEQLLIPPLLENGLPEEDKPSDSTPTGDELPLVNGIQEEELGYSSGAGGTSDQSTSEDSSLTDSDRTIIGEVVPECPLSSPSDPDHQMSPAEAQPGGESAQLNSVPMAWHKVCVASFRRNGESNIWKPTCVEGNNYYLKVTPYASDEGHRMLRVVVDKATDLSVLKQKLEKYLRVDSKFMVLFKGPEDGVFIQIYSLRSCKDDEKVTIRLERVLGDGERWITVHLLDLKSSTPAQHIFEWIVSDGESIAAIKKVLLKEVEKRASLKIPFERCRLREQSVKNPGRVLMDSEVWDEKLQTNVYLQELDGPDPVTDSSQTLLFTRRWHPSSDTLSRYQEIILDSNSSTPSLSKRLGELSDIPVEHIKFARSKVAFAFQSIKRLKDLTWETDHDNEDLINNWDKESGAIVFYRDDREEIKSEGKESKEKESGEQQDSTSSSSNTMSYISGYSPRKERALKIYLDTAPRRARSVIDVD